MSNLVAITTYSNPDLLWIYLDQLSASPIRNQFKYRLFTEPGYDKEIDEVVKHFSFLDISLKVRERHKECPLTGFYNITQSYIEAAEETDEYVIPGEDDLLPVKGVLEFYDEVYRKFLKGYDRIFCLAHKRRPENELKGDPNVLIGDYQLTSPSCISKEMILKYVKPHATEEIFNDPIQYYWKNFNNIRLKPYDHQHWDGFWERCMLSANLFALKPDQARSCHVGLRGIHSKGFAPKGILMEKVEQYKELIRDGDKLRSLSHMPSDMVVADLDKIVEYTDLKLDTERNLAKASSFWYDPENEFKNYIYG